MVVDIICWKPHCGWGRGRGKLKRKKVWAVNEGMGDE